MTNTSHPSVYSSLAYQLAATLDGHSCGHPHSAEGSSFLSTTTVDLNELLTRKQNSEDTDILDTQNFYKYDNFTPQSLKHSKPWKINPTYFQTVYISSLALMKMTIHADSGGDIEVMGMLIGKIINKGMVVMDTYSLPVVGTETRVNAQAESYEYMVSYLDHLKKSGYRNENIIGWYHSHPGYGCWLSGIDVATESLNQKFQDPYLAIVIDPKKTKLDGKVEIGAFRTYPEDADVSSPANTTTVEMDGSNGTVIPDVKLKDFGAHCSEYYSLDVKVFKSKSDESVLKLLLDNYWISGLTDLIDDDDDEDLNLLNKLDTIIDTRLISAINKFDKNYPKISAKLSKKSDNKINLKKKVVAKKPEFPGLKLPNYEVASNIEIMKLHQHHQLGKKKKDDEISEDYYDEEVYDEDEDYEEDDDGDELSGFMNSRMTESLSTLKPLNEVVPLVDINMKEVDDEDMEENYNSVDSDTSIDNISTFSSSSGVITNPKSSSHASKINSGSSSATSEIEAKSSVASEIDDEKKSTEFDSRYRRGKNIGGYYETLQAVSRKSSSGAHHERQQSSTNNQNKFTEIGNELANLSNLTKSIAGEDLRNSISLKLQQELFF
ncbi:COP9 signalosome catalytic subunit [Saccharomycopsis crataegensis]|uniref:COP9 signalosome complex subunit 5 n=1 Tax=Saccharomycopsis crataegensis TaxID=43959 RepID=A0AAV5QQ22_9ASCO|nr:COP9 signalosome catalytic subunit [Saccharomycopsis crataegensis]